MGTNRGAGSTTMTTIVVILTPLRQLMLMATSAGTSTFQRMDREWSIRATTTFTGRAIPMATIVIGHRATRGEIG